MKRFPSFTAVATVSALMLGAPPARAAPVSPDATSAIEVSSQATTMRPRPRIRVYPRYPRRNYHTLYALPYGMDYPGPNAVRQCASRLVPEYRPSGTVIVPRMRCWWAWR